MFDFSGDRFVSTGAMICELFVLGNIVDSGKTARNPP